MITSVVKKSGDQFITFTLEPSGETIIREREFCEAMAEVMADGGSITVKRGLQEIELIIEDTVPIQPPDGSIH